MINVLKTFIGFLICLIFRLLPFRPANFEPVLSTLMPISYKLTWVGSFIFGFLSIGIYDLATNFGIWTILTGCAYGLLGIFANLYFKNKTHSRLNYLKFSIWGTLAYDAVTGLGIGPLLFHQTFTQAFIGQIPFTARHLLGNITLAYFLSPLIYKWVANNPKIELSLGWLRVRSSEL